MTDATVTLILLQKYLEISTILRLNIILVKRYFSTLACYQPFANFLYFKHSKTQRHRLIHFFHYEKLQKGK